MDQRRSLAVLLESSGPSFDGDPALAVSGLAYDSRRIEPGQAFVAIPGFQVNGLDFVDQALERGAVAVVAEQDRPGSRQGAEPSVWARVPDARRALALMSCAWFDHPSHRIPVVGVTGTNGKTTVTALLEVLLATLGPTGRWSTTQLRVAGISSPTPRTTPESLDLQQTLAQMVAAGCQTATIEVSSHALVLQRTAGTRFAGAVFTNLSPDHLDFHHDMNDYLAAKSLLFTDLPETAPAVINFSDPAAAALAARCSGRVVGFGWKEDVQGNLPTASYPIHGFSPGPTGSLLRLEIAGSVEELRTPLFGRANAENLAAAVAMALELGVDLASVARAVADFQGEPGRFEAVDVGQNFRILVDYAHTPAALESALEAARSEAGDGQVLVVFGCGGDRDRTKRAPMGRIAAAGADRVIATSDNPRSEDPEAILAGVMAGVPQADRHRVSVVPDRARAIAVAIGAAVRGDCVLIAGKGHEKEQVFADRTIPFDDRLVASEAARQHLDGLNGGTL